MRVVFDTNVLVAALLSQRGASHHLMERLAAGDFTPVLTAALCLEYEDVLFRPELITNLTTTEIDDFLRFFVESSDHCQTWFSWRPFLRDPKDDMVIEAALAGNSQMIVVSNRWVWLQCIPENLWKF